ncbi:amino acid dehydrogenase [Mycobacterium alsense]|uniref:Amino acid dehydrogenase n=1 Tax=Mycobacterium alsense TaxID=324058 RepID=A0ABD6P3F5_9MYCO|nr:FAD-binding oxidoreductase [Mycobacterium alsense]OBG38168.1 amino acid dehydrogenase [Mycobacterium alsense]
MVGVDRIGGAPRSAIVVGAGIAGLSAAWFLQERGVTVTVVDRSDRPVGASCGNGGWVAPGLALPLNCPDVLRRGLRALRDPTAPLHFPLAAETASRVFLTQFLANSEHSPWQRAMRANAPLNEDAIEAFDVLVANGVDAPVTDTPITAVFRTAAEAEHMLRQLRQLENDGQATHVTALSGEALRGRMPLASPAITAALNVDGQRFADPRRFLDALRRAVVDRGATMHRLEAGDVVSSGREVAVHSRRGVLTADAVVIATGPRLPQMAGRWLRVPVQVGRGYSFTVPVDHPLPAPIFLRGAMVACTPLEGAMRVSGTLEFRHPHRAAIKERVGAIVASAAPLLDKVRWDDLFDVRVDAYAVTPDGLPLIGEVSPGVYVAGGHGVWGFAHGPVTGRLLAEQITTGKLPGALAEFDPLRLSGGRHSRYPAA